MTVTNGKTSDIKLLTKVTVMALYVHIILEIKNQWKLKKHIMEIQKSNVTQV